MGGGRLVAGRAQLQRDLKRVQLRTGYIAFRQRRDLGEQVRQTGERQVGFAGRGLAAQQAVAGRRGRLDPGPPQRRLARAGLTLDGQRGGRDPDLLGEVTNPVSFGRTDEIAPNRSHTHIPPQSGRAEEIGGGVNPARSGLLVMCGCGG
jgi:hypothetical protein